MSFNSTLTTLKSPVFYFLVNGFSKEFIEHGSLAVDLRELHIAYDISSSSLGEHYYLCLVVFNFIIGPLYTVFIDLSPCDRPQAPPWH